MIFIIIITFLAILSPLHTYTTFLIYNNFNVIFVGSRGAAGVIIGAGGGNSGSGAARSVVSLPAPYVPEDLVSQAQVVLQGKSRNLIIRELQVIS